MVEKVQETRLYQKLREKESKFLPQVDNVVNYASNMLPLINNVFTNYTVHGIKHSINVMEYMCDLLADIDKLSELEIVSLIYSALLHDIGMVANDTEIADIKADNVTFGERKYSKVLEKYGEEKIALQECIRPIHGRRSKDHIDNNMNSNLFLIPESTVVSFREEVGLICMAHNEDFEWIEKNLSFDGHKGRFELNAQYVAVLLRLADYLDIDAQRAPLYLYQYLEPKEFSDLEWKQHFVIENYDKVVYNERTGLKEIVFQGFSREPSVHRKLLRYFDSINGELRNAVNLCEKYPDKKYLLVLKTSVTNKIQTRGFSFSDMRLSLNYVAVTNLLMGEHIYGNKKYGLRELIQNSIDACKTMEEVSLQMEEYRYKQYEPFISIVLDKDRQQVRVLDNGSGMSINILKNYFLNVGVSYYTSDDYLLQGRNYSPIGHYGIGFLACFMLSDKVEVNTMHYTDRKMNSITFERNSEYICLTCEETRRTQGTEIILDYNQCLGVFGDDIGELVTFIENNFIDCNIPIKVSAMENGVSNEIDCELKKINNILDESICLSPYLNGIDAYIKCNYRNINFNSSISGINGWDSYWYKEEGSILEEAYELNIQDCVEDGKIYLLQVPLITDGEAEEFLKAFEVLEDYDEALHRIGGCPMVNIWGNTENVYDYEGIISEPSEPLIGQYTLRDFREQFGHSSEVPVQTQVIEPNVIINEAAKILPYKKKRRFGETYLWEPADKCYLKNVLLSKLRIEIPSLVDRIKLKEAVINITNPEFIPNVSRNDISVQQQKKLSYAIGKALHMWLRDNAGLSSDEKSLLDLFIEKQYGEQNSYLK